MRISEDIKRDVWMCSKLCRKFKDGELRKDHPQQRRPDQWTSEDRDNFIVTVLLNEDFDPIKICEQIGEDGKTDTFVIDGLQKSTYIENFKSGKFALGKNIDPQTIEWDEPVLVNGEQIKDEDGNVIKKEVSFDLRGKSYKDLPEQLKENFNNCPVQIIKHLNSTNKSIGRNSVRYNAGKKMVPSQKIVTYMDKTAKAVKDLSGHAFFNDCANYSQASDKSGKVDKVVCESVMMLNFYEAWNKDVKKIGKYLNENATDTMFDTFKGYLDRLLNVITPETGKLFSEKNALIWFKIFDKFSNSGLEDKRFNDFLEDIEDLKRIKIEVSKEYELVKGSGEYTNKLSFSELDGIASTKDKGILNDKIHILETLMNEYLHIKHTENSSDFNIEETQSEEANPLSFIQENVSQETTSEDVDFYNDMLDDLTLNVDNSSKLLDKHNKPSLLAIIAYSCINDIDLDEWFIAYFKYNKEYITDQKQNYISMVQNISRYTNGKLSA